VKPGAGSAPALQARGAGNGPALHTTPRVAVHDVGQTCPGARRSSGHGVFVDGLRTSRNWTLRERGKRALGRSVAREPVRAGPGRGGAGGGQTRGWGADPPGTSSRTNRPHRPRTGRWGGGGGTFGTGPRPTGAKKVAPRRNMEARNRLRFGPVLDTAAQPRGGHPSWARQAAKMAAGEQIRAEAGGRRRRRDQFSFRG